MRAIHPNRNSETGQLVGKTIEFPVVASATLFEKRDPLRAVIPAKYYHNKTFLRI
jgi:hypothetical protein